MLHGIVEGTVLDRLPFANIGHSYLARIQGYREYRPGGWHPTIRVEGVAHIAAALDRGHGVVLWVARLVYSDLVTKKGLSEAGIQCSHLSRPGHNISTTPFGVRVLNPTWTRIENRYLAERVMIRNDDAAAALATLRARLRKNRVVSIAVGDRARNVTRVDFLNGKLSLATGPLHLARTMNAVLLPVFTVMQDDGSFTVNVESPLIEGQEDAAADYDGIAQRYARRLERYLLRYPDQWNAAVLGEEPSSASRTRQADKDKLSI